MNKYKENVIDKLGVKSYIWKMHNWSGNYDNLKIPEVEELKKVVEDLCA